MRKSLHLDERQYSPALQAELIQTALRATSFEQAQEVARIWNGPPVSSRHLGRVVEAVGRELEARRDAEVDDFTHHRREPAPNDPVHERAVVFVDGGRVQVRDEAPGHGNGVHNAQWREDKVARLQTMTGLVHAVDPCPEPPPCFLDPKALKGLVAPDPVPDTTERSPEPAPPVPASGPRPEERWQPEPVARSGVATMRPIESFRWMVQAEAKRRHFYAAQKRAFVADGSACNWTLQARHVPDFVPILDFLHAAAYRHDAAKALGDPARATGWVRAAWQRRVGEVVVPLRDAVGVAVVGDHVLGDDHPLRAVQKALTYLTNHADKMDDPRYRREGRPTTSSLIESQIKEFHRRVKGTEKFWNPSNAEAMLQLLVWSLRDDGPTLNDYMANRPGCSFRRRTDTQTTPSIAI